MARRKKPGKRKQGPFLAAAVFCDNVMRGDDNALTVVRIIDHISLGVPAALPDSTPSQDIGLIARTCALLAFKNVDARRGKHEVELVMNSPSGGKFVIGKHELNFKGDAHGGANIRLNLAMGVNETGLYVADVKLDGKVMTRMPLLITAKRDDGSPIPTGVISVKVIKGKKR